MTNLARDLKLKRESEWTCKISVTKQCKNVHALAVGIKAHPNLSKVQPEIWRILKEESHDHWKSIVELSLSQGDVANLLETCESDLSRKYIMFSLPKGVLKFAINASMDQRRI